MADYKVVYWGISIDGYSSHPLYIEAMNSIYQREKEREYTICKAILDDAMNIKLIDKK